MEELVASIISGIASKYLSKYSEAAVKKVLGWAIKQKPELKEHLVNIEKDEDAVNFFHEAVGVIDAHAGKGSIVMKNVPLIKALRSARFNHEKGQVIIDNSIITAPKLRTGGGKGATGRTKVKDSKLKSAGTEISGKGYEIIMDGDAYIDQN